MALTGDELRFHYTVASGYEDPQADPDQSLGGYRSEDFIQEREGDVTTAGTTFVFTDSKQINLKPVSPDSRTPLVNSDDYASASTFVHWYRPGYGDADTEMGIDHATAGTPRDISLQRSLDSSDLSSEQPGQFDQQRESVTFTGAAGNQQIRQSPAVSWGIANAWSIFAWVRPTSTAAGTFRIFRMGPSATQEWSYEITFWRDGTTLHVRIAGSTSTTQIYQTYNSFFALDTWVYIVVTWNGTTLQVYKDGSPVSWDTQPDNDSVTQIDSTRYFSISGLRMNYTDPLEEWEGQIHSVGMWSSTLAAAEVADLVDFGDGEGDPALDHTGKWLVFITGANAVDARKIIYHDNTTGEMGFKVPWGTAPVIGEIFRISGARHLFDDVTAQQCAEGHVDYRGISFYNTTGGSLTDVRFYIIPLDPGTTGLDIACGNAQIGASDMDTISPDTQEPNLVTDSAFSSTRPQSFRRPDDYASGKDAPASGTSFSLANFFHSNIWIRRTTPALSKRKDSAAWLLVMEETGGTKTAVPIVYDVLGYDVAFSLDLDRIPRTFGGSRVTARVADDTLGQAAQDESVTIEIDSGPGTLVSETQPLDTDVNGEAFAIYHSPEDDAEAGNSVTITSTFWGDPT